MKLYNPTFKDKDGKRKAVSKYWVRLRDHEGCIRRFAGFTDKRQSELLGEQVQRLINCRAAGEQPDVNLSRWIEQMPSKLRAKLAGWKLLDRKRATGQQLKGHIEDFKASLFAKGNTKQHSKLTAARVLNIVEGCKFKAWSDIQASKVERYLLKR